jgi:hypothetical protein
MGNFGGQGDAFPNAARADCSLALRGAAWSLDPHAGSRPYRGRTDESLESAESGAVCHPPRKEGSA